MTEVHRYKAVQLISMGGAHIGYDPYGPDVVMASAYDELRAQLAGRDELLRDFLEVATGGFSDSDHVLRVRHHLETFLSASAQPSAPAAPYPNRLCHIDYTAHPYQCGCLKGDEESQRRYDEQVGRATAEPRPPVELGVSQLERER